MSILIKNILVQGKETSVFIEDNIISELGKKQEADYVIDGTGKALLPGFVNTHTHAAMTLMRGYADDLELDEWLTTVVWPLELNLKSKDVYWGTKLACLEMLKSGTTCFNDMYFFVEEAARAVIEMGLRAVLSYAFIDLGNTDGARRTAQIEKVTEFIKNQNNSRLDVAVAPHAIYTVSEDSLLWCKDYASKNNLLIHFHLAETEKEANEFLKSKNMRIVEYLEKINFLCENLVCAHSIWLSKKEIELLSNYNVKISYNPTSNMKLGSGIMPYQAMKEHGLVVSLGTDGCASNNNLDMFEEMKFAALLQKLNRTGITAKDVFDMATLGGAQALALNAGVIQEGKLADLVIVDLKKTFLTPGHNLISDLVYSANGSCVDTVICDGNIVMENRKVKREEEILEKARDVALDFVSRVKK